MSVDLLRALGSDGKILVNTPAALFALGAWQGAVADPRRLAGSPAMRNGALGAATLGDALAACRFASAAYGRVGAAFFRATDPERSVLSRLAAPRELAARECDAFCALAGVEPAALLYESGAPGPKHWLAAHAPSRSLVLAVRGTLSMEDVLSDTNAAPVAFARGRAHEGMARGADSVYARTRDIIARELAVRPGWGLTVTGHSLGAATAILFTIRLMHERELAATAAAADADADAAEGGGAAGPLAGTPIRCIAFASPPTFAPLSALPRGCAAAIVNFVHREDMVSRLSIDSIGDVLRVLGKLSARMPSLPERLWAGGVDVEALLTLDEREFLHAWTGRYPPLPPAASDGGEAVPASAAAEAGAACAGGGSGSDGSGSGRQNHLRLPGRIFAFRSPCEMPPDYSDGTAADANAVRKGSAAAAVAIDATASGAAAAVEAEAACFADSASGASLGGQTVGSPRSTAGESATASMASHRAARAAAFGPADRAAAIPERRETLALRVTPPASAGLGAPLPLSPGAGDGGVDGGAPQPPPTPTPMPPAVAPPPSPTVLDLLHGGFVAAAATAAVTVSSFAALTLSVVTGAASAVEQAGRRIIVGPAAAGALPSPPPPPPRFAPLSADTDDHELPFVTEITPEDLAHLPVTGRSWRDHHLDCYLFGLRELHRLAMAQFEAQLEREAKEEPPPPMPVSTPTTPAPARRS